MQVNGQTFVLYAPASTSEPGQSFTVVLPPEKGLAEEYSDADDFSHGQMGAPTNFRATSSTPSSGNAEASSADTNPFGRPSGNYRGTQSNLAWD